MLSVFFRVTDTACIYCCSTKYLACCGTVDLDTWDRNDIAAYTTKVLRFWRSFGAEFPELTKAARIAFSMSASSAASERVFSLMKRFFGKHAGRDSSLADQLRASLQLSYNRRVAP